ncbi:unnamed protein product [Psylliodes chrysocephalus]|uniref:Transposase n=1 Tax=Psylliodes chrysocephalus TaxID=3402493 RepID=A0A9P0CX39_9CUCU|nr:unnamed protein product [Psylliodes chrysocephala]
MVEEIKTLLSNTQFVCSTADIWSSKNRSFMGSTCHWIDTDSLQRKSVALACRRLPGTHSFDKIGEMFEEIYTEFGLNWTKTLAKITDNGSKFVKAFKEYGIQLETRVILNSIPSSIQIDNKDCDTNDSIELQDDIFQPGEVRGSEYEQNIYLPNHFRCVTHTLNLIATTDIMNSINKNHTIRSKHTNITNKCTQLWNKSGRPKSAKEIKKILGHYLSYPSATRWNSFYDSLTQILKQKEKLNILYESLNLNNMPSKKMR